ncbi:MAG: helix-turn-helix transcriptional regulator [Lachnospiraceae bacterium]|nr:helix-turn-helix transcriptional regulator [Lachnospiraceae bacterium]
MILADKIIELRKKNGWSQEELADLLDVSRQSVSKWESAQSVPDMNRILKLSEVFGVSTDYLLKDDMTAPEYVSVPEADTDLRTVSMEEAQAFLAVKEKNARQVSLGVLLCILSPAMLILLGTLREGGKISLSESGAAGIGLTVLFLMVGAAVALFVLTGIRSQKYEYIEKESIETAYGVSGSVREQMTRFAPRFTACLTAGIVLCVISVVPLMLSLFLFENSDLARGISVVFILLAVACGAFLIVRVAIVQGGYQMLLEEGGYTRREKLEQKKTGWISGVYWMAVTAVFLVYSFVTGRWDRSWIIWAVSGIVYALLIGIVKGVMSRKKEG